ncbi:MAG: hypothetical protein QOH69_2958 [Actinomycetota bacterium]|jgi:hypothetical protein|nr:hypothetical protein [Actinomycetota bacterium]
MSNTIPPSRKLSIFLAAQHVHVNERTVERWLGAGLIVGYVDGKNVLVDLDEIEAGFRLYPQHMRDGRRPKFGPNVRLVPLSKVEQ